MKIGRLLDARLLLIVLFGYHVYSWRNSKVEFLRRIFLAVPFALMFGLFVKLIGFSTPRSAFFAAWTYWALLCKTPSWKHHFCVTLPFVCGFAMMGKFRSLLSHHIPAQLGFAEPALCFAAISPLIFFFVLYMREIDGGKTPDLRVVLVKSVKLSLVFSSYFAGFTIIYDLGTDYGISSTIQTLACCLMSILFVVILYSLDLLPWQFEQKSKKKSKLDELQSELNNVYQEELRKVKKP